MYADQKVIVVMPAYNAARTLARTYIETVRQDYVDCVVVVDDASQDQTMEVAGQLDQAVVFRHTRNAGYGANQKTCYALALEEGADIVVMVHPDYQYTPKLIPAMVSLIGNGLYHCVLGSRILGGHAIRNGMPWWRYVANRGLTLVENLMLQSKLSEFHTGYRAFSRSLLETIPYSVNSDDFVFDNQMLAQILWAGYTVAEVSCPTRYFAEASSINFARSVIYGMGCLKTGLEYRLCDWLLTSSPRFPRMLRNHAT